MSACPACHATVGDSDEFCEACGAELSPTAAAEVPMQEGAESPIELSAVIPQPNVPEVGEAGVNTSQPNDTAQHNVDSLKIADVDPADLSGTESTCRECGGVVDSDGYCGTCGARGAKRRDHFREQPAAWVAAVCDRGIRHTRNEDAMALAADAKPGSRAVLVVCDGVSSSVDSDQASLAAARAARDVLASSNSQGMGTGTSHIAAVVARLATAADAASAAVLEVTANAATTNSAAGQGDGPEPATNPASCTFVAAVLEQDLLVVGSVGDSRAYWIPDVGTATALTLDDSFSQMQIAAGVPRGEAESGPQSHAITRWLGADAPDHKPTTATMTLAEPGWLLVCSDGLWNYCSAAQDLADLVRQTSSMSPAAAEPMALASALVDWANAQGGQDNITAALARIGPVPAHPGAGSTASSSSGASALVGASAPSGASAQSGAPSPSGASAQSGAFSSGASASSPESPSSPASPSPVTTPEKEPRDG
jgi:serine/threonine protein phosphatase PrpC